MSDVNNASYIISIFNYSIIFVLLHRELIGFFVPDFSSVCSSQYENTSTIWSFKMVCSCSCKKDDTLRDHVKIWKLAYTKIFRVDGERDLGSEWYFRVEFMIEFVLLSRLRKFKNSLWENISCVGGERVQLYTDCLEGNHQNSWHRSLSPDIRDLRRLGNSASKTLHASYL